MYSGFKFFTEMVNGHNKMTVRDKNGLEYRISFDWKNRPQLDCNMTNHANNMAKVMGEDNAHFILGGLNIFATADSVRANAGRRVCLAVVCQTSILMSPPWTLS